MHFGCPPYGHVGASYLAFVPLQVPGALVSEPRMRRLVWLIGIGCLHVLFRSSLFCAISTLGLPRSTKLGILTEQLTPLLGGLRRSTLGPCVV
jgi:hypothetical protein